MPQATGIVGRKSGATGEQAHRIDPVGSLITADGAGRYMDAVLSGNVYIAVTTAAAAFGATLSATTTTGIINPVGSGKNLVLLRLGVALSTQPTLGTGVTLAASSTLVPTVTASASMTIKNALLSGGNPSSVVIACAATANVLTGTPFAVYPLTVSSATTVAPPPTDNEFAGLFIVPPGGAVGINCTAATSGWATFVWHELPV
jgi:hypothetical protein